MIGSRVAFGPGAVVDHPRRAVSLADRLINEALKARGVSDGRFEERPRIFRSNTPWSWRSLSGGPDCSRRCARFG